MSKTCSSVKCLRLPSGSDLVIAEGLSVTFSAYASIARSPSASSAEANRT